MPYSKLNNILFIHIPKCAGKSFEVALNLTTKEEAFKYTWRSFLNKVSKYFLILTRDKKSKLRLWGVLDISLTSQHLTYAEIELLDLLDRTILDESIKVAIVRNPYDRAVSSYNHMNQNHKYKNFLDFAKNYYLETSKRHNDLAHKRSQIDFLRNKNGELIVDNIIRFENLNNDFILFRDKFNIQCNSLPFISNSSQRKHYSDYYCKESKTLIEAFFKEDIRIFDYKF